MGDERCEDCRYWLGPAEHQTTDDGVVVGNSGRCRRYPPTLMMLPGGAISYPLPVVRDDDWCGEWRGKASVGEVGTGLMDAHFTAVLPASVTLPKEDRVNARAAKEVAERALCDLANRRGNYPPADAPGYAWKRAVSKAATVADLCSLTESNLMAAGYPSTQERTRRAVLFIKESLAAKGLSLCGDEP